MSHQIKGRTVRVADRGLSSSQNIVLELTQGDGYVFSKLFNTLAETEKSELY